MFLPKDTPWSVAMEQFLIDHCNTLTDKEMAQRLNSVFYNINLNLTGKDIADKRHKLKIKRHWGRARKSKIVPVGRGRDILKYEGRNDAGADALKKG